MGKRMKKTTRREEYKEKFNEQMNKWNIRKKSYLK